MEEILKITGEKYTTIPEGTQFISKDTINIYSWEIEELHVPDSIVAIELGALKGCSNLKKLVIPAKFCLTAKEIELKYLSKNESTKSDIEQWLDNVMQYGEYRADAALFSFFENEMPTTLEELVIYGNETELDLSEIDLGRCFRYGRNKNLIIRIENEITSLKLGNKYGDKKPLIFINNYIENVEIEADEKIWSRDLFIFRAPKPNLNQLDDCAIELTLAPRETFRDDARWSCPIKINVEAVTYLCPKEMTSFESDKYLGTRLLLLGDRIGDISLQNLNMETYPFVIVWEDEETVYSKLKEKGWTRDN